MTHPWPTGSCGRGGEACGDVTAPIPLIVKQGRDPNKDMDQLSRFHALQVSRLPTESSLLVRVPVQISIQPYKLMQVATKRLSKGSKCIACFGSYYLL